MLRNSDDQHHGGVGVADVQVHPLLQRQPADGLGLNHSAASIWKTLSYQYTVRSIKNPTPM